MAPKPKQQQAKPTLLSAFTLIELMIVVAVIAILAGLVSFSAVSIQKTSRDTTRDANVKIISTALEKYYRKNGEYPSVALMTSQDVATIKQKLGIVSTNVFKLPLADDATKNSIVTSSPSPSRVVYVANTSDSTKNTQCQTDANGYCDGFTLQYKKEANGNDAVITSLHNTFTPVAGTATCAQGETQSGNTCTRTYAATQQQGAYTCPNGGTLSNTTCTQTYTATYSSGGGYYTCNSGDSLSGSTCTHTTSATYVPGGYYCGSSPAPNDNTCGTGSPTQVNNYYCPHGADSMMSQWTCQHPRSGYGTQSGCQNAGYNWQSGSCYEYHSTSLQVIYVCPSGTYLVGTYCYVNATYQSAYYTCSSGSVSGSSCITTYSATYNSYSGGYYCNSGDGSPSGTTCTHTYAATQGASYYTCPSGGTVSGSTCTYTYTLP